MRYSISSLNAGRRTPGTARERAVDFGRGAVLRNRALAHELLIGQ